MRVELNGPSSPQDSPDTTRLYPAPTFSSILSMQREESSEKSCCERIFAPLFKAIVRFFAWICCCKTISDEINFTLNESDIQGAFNCDGLFDKNFRTNRPDSSPPITLLVHLKLDDQEKKWICRSKEEIASICQNALELLRQAKEPHHFSFNAFDIVRDPEKKAAWCDQYSGEAYAKGSKSGRCSEAGGTPMSLKKIAENPNLPRGEDGTLKPLDLSDDAFLLNNVLPYLLSIRPMTDSYPKT